MFMHNIVHDQVQKLMTLWAPEIVHEMYIWLTPLHVIDLIGCFHDNDILSCEQGLTL